MIVKVGRELGTGNMADHRECAVHPPESTAEEFFTKNAVS